MPIKLNSAGGGSVTINAASTAAATVLTVPATNANIVTTGDTGSITGGMIASNTISQSNLSQGLTTMATFNMNAGGTFTTFTDIPSWVRRVTVCCIGFIAAGYAPLVRLGYGSTPTYVSSGYSSSTALFGNSNNTGINNYTDGFYGVGGSGGLNMYMSLVLFPSTNYWQMGGTVSAAGQPYGGIINGYISLGQQLTAIRVSAAAGATFSSGLIQVMYE